MRSGTATALVTAIMALAMASEPVPAVTAQVVATNAWVDDGGQRGVLLEVTATGLGSGAPATLLADIVVESAWACGDPAGGTRGASLGTLRIRTVGTGDERADGRGGARHVFDAIARPPACPDGLGDQVAVPIGPIEIVEGEACLTDASISVREGCRPIGRTTLLR